MGWLFGYWHLVVFTQVVTQVVVYWILEVRSAMFQLWGAHSGHPNTEYEKFQIFPKIYNYIFGSKLTQILFKENLRRKMTKNGVKKETFWCKKNCFYNINQRIFIFNFYLFSTGWHKLIQKKATE